MYNHGITVASQVQGVTEMITAVMMHDVTVVHGVTQCKVLGHVISVRRGLC